MSSFGTITAVLDFAIKREQEAIDFYGSLAGQATNPSLKKVFLSFAKEEQGHKEKLLAVKSNKSILVDKTEVADLKISDYLVSVDPQNVMSFQDALVVAIKREKAAMELYTVMSKRVEDPALRDLFKKLAHEESAHKTRFETMYEEHFLPEN
ncbi:MAG: ferritin family protein [Lentisphaerae bacterium]|jgi:rubrerythrin|nr:ferritin family protein [Lentisphaerota bacterium]